MAVRQEDQWFSGPEFREYREYGLQPNPLPLNMDAVMDSATVTKTDFISHPTEKRQPVKPASGNLKQEGVLDFTSSYSTSFQGRPGERRQPLRRQQERPELGKFVGEPSYKADFKEWSLPPRHRREADKWEPPAEPFGGDSITKKDFVEHPPSPRETYKPQEMWKAPEKPFSDATDYRETFQEHPLPKREHRRRETWQRPAAKFDGITTQKQDFVGSYQPKRESMRPNRGAFASDAPFDGTTTFMTDFDEKPISPRYVHAYQPYSKPEGNIEFRTTNKVTYTEFPVQRTGSPEKPTSSHILRGTGSFAKESAYLSDFTEHQIQRREMLKPKANYEPPNARFEGQTTNQRDYVEKELSPRENYRPKREALQSDEPFENSTAYRASFIKHSLPPKPLREREVYAAPRVPFEARTTQQDSFLGEFVPKRSSFRPDYSQLATDAKFEANTTSKSDFKKHDLPPRYRHEAERYTKPEGTMDMRTSNQDTFREFRAERQAVNKPGSSHVLWGEGKVEDCSSYKGDFVKLPLQGRHDYKPKNEYQPSSEKFDIISTQKASFTGVYAPKQASCKPPPKPLQNLGAFDDVSSYRQEYDRERYTWQDLAREIPPMSV